MACANEKSRDAVRAIEGDEDNGDDQTPSSFQKNIEEDDVYGDGGLGLRALLDAE